MSEDISCRLCNSAKVNLLFPGTSLPLFKCRECRVVFRPSPTTPKDLEAIYNEDYFRKKWPGSLGRFFDTFNPEHHHKTRFFIQQLKAFEGLLGGPGRLLDVGCANGVFVWLAKERGWEAEGLEISPFAADHGRNQFGVTIHDGDIHDLPPDRHYDLITLWDTIEHLADPAQTLHACYARLAPGGFMGVLTPDVSSLVNYLVHTYYRLAPRQAEPYLEKLYHSDHLTCFDRETLCLSIIKAGFTIHWIEDYDEDPRDTETTAPLRALLFLVHLTAALFHRKHEIIIWTEK